LWTPPPDVRETTEIGRLRSQLSPRHALDLFARIATGELAARG